MAIKSISKLDPFYNEGVTDQYIKPIGGALRIFNDKGRNSDAKARDTACAGPADHLEFHTMQESSNDGRSESYYNSLFEISKPADKASEGMQSEEFFSFKITYKDIAKNLILDTKNYLNIRNNLGDFNLCAIVFDDYVYKGHKYFLPGNDLVENPIQSDVGYNETSKSGIDIKQGPGDSYGLSVDGNVKITGNADITGNTWIGGNTTIEGYLKVNSDISGFRNFYLNNILCATTSQVTIAPSLSLGNNLIVHGTTLFQNNITGTNAYLTGTLTCNSITANYGNITNLTVTNGNITNLTATNGHFTNLTCTNVAQLTAAHAQWSDLAEYYLADAKYEAGTLMQFGGSNEVTIAKNEVNAIVTSKPAFLMNSSLKDNPLGCPLALAGRIPVKVIGKINKFDKIVLSEIPGIGKVIENEGQKVIGRALESNDNANIKLVECIVRIDL